MLRGFSAIIRTRESILSWGVLTQNSTLSIEEMVGERRYKLSHAPDRILPRVRRVRGQAYDLLRVPSTEMCHLIPSLPQPHEVIICTHETGKLKLRR